MAFSNYVKARRGNNYINVIKGPQHVDNLEQFTMSNMSEKDLIAMRRAKSKAMMKTLKRAKGFVSHQGVMFPSVKR